MRTRLWRFLGSWRRSLLVVVGCFAYLTLLSVTAHLLPQVASSLGRVGLIIVVVLWCLWLIAALALSCVGAYLVVGVLRPILTPILTRAFPETPWAERSARAKEKVADSVLSISNAVFSALLIGVLVAPFTAALQAVVGRRDLGVVLWPLLTPGEFPRWHVILLIVLFALPVVGAARLRTRALDIYDELARKATPAPSPGPNGATATTRACPASVDPPMPSGGRSDTDQPL